MRYPEIHSISPRSGNLIRPDAKTLQRVRPERRGDSDIACIAPSRHQDAASARRIVAWVEQAPPASDPGLEPGREIARRKWRRRSRVAQVAGAIARRHIHSAAKSAGQMRAIAANAGPFFEGLRGAAGRPGVLVVEGNMAMNVIAEGWPGRVARRPAAKEPPSRLAQKVGLAIAAPQQEHES